jgi:hypothetical protein
MKQDRMVLFEQGLARCRALLLKHSDSRALRSIEKQIEFLIDLEMGRTSEVGRLQEITIGVLTAREVEPLDEEVAELLYEVASEARRM